jgi:hypothetical protein
MKSPWSATRSFTVGAAEMEDLFKPTLLAPAAGAANTSLTPTFMWTEVEGAVTYELEISDNPAFRGVEKGTAPLFQRAGIVSNVLILDMSLEYDTAYYWRVRATTTAASRPGSEGELGEWVTGVFSTMSAPEAPAEPTEPVVIPPAQEITPGWIYAIIAIGAILIIAVLVLIVRTRRVV